MMQPAALEAAVIRNQPALRQARRFFAVGISTVCLDYALLYILVSRGGVNYFVAAAIAFLVASAINYLLSIRWVFVPGKYRKSFEISLFFLTSSAGLLVNQASMWMLVDLLSLNYLVGKLFTITIVTLWNFVSKKKLVFID